MLFFKKLIAYLLFPNVNNLDRLDRRGYGMLGWRCDGVLDVFVLHVIIPLGELRGQILRDPGF